MNKRLYVIMAALAILALGLSACANPAADRYGQWWEVNRWWDTPLGVTLAQKCADGRAQVTIGDGIYDCPATEVAPAPVDLCADQVNPAWGNLIAKNSLQQAVYEDWLANVAANGGAIYGASKCSLPVDSHVFGPTDTVDKSGPAQLVTAYRFDGIWHPSVDVTYTLASGCTFEPQFSQGDAPVAVYRAPGTIRLTNNVSNGVSLVGQVTCP